MKQSDTDSGLYEEGVSHIIADVTLGDRNADIFITRDGRIGAVGVNIRRDYAGEADFIIDGSGRIAIPGCTNTHTHAAMTLLRGYADDMHLQEWLSEKIWPLEAHLTGEDVYWGTRLACLEMIRSGTVAFNDMYFFMEDAARAVDEAGLKAQFAYGFIDLFDEEKRETEIKATETLVSAVKRMDNPRIRAAVGPHAIYTVSKEGLEWCAAYSEEQNIGIHIHLSETEKEVNDCVEQTGMRPAALLDSCGCLTPRTVAAHCCWLERAECDLLGKRGVFVSHNPASNMKLAVNRAMPYHWLHAAGASVTLGTDGCASNNNLDIFEEMKFAALLQKFFWNSDTLLPATEALLMATENGARALGFGTGRIEAGAPADLVLLDQRSPCMVPRHHTVSNIVYACAGSAVRTVFCQGRVLMNEGFIPGEDAILTGAEKAASSLVLRANGA
ncbi:MAG: amidohydrolase family protein [Methanomicrobiaceae archaeon]|nr:amidohydrolase family protein [Methanomicrobiaceae archaeon]